MKNTTHTQTSYLCDNGLLERPRYFPRQLMTPTEMTLEQTYFRDKLRRHNRWLHGWGVVCGAEVCPIPNTNGSGAQPWMVAVTAGYLLGPYGDEIVIAAKHALDLRTSGVTGVTGESPLNLGDPWCAEIVEERQPGKLWLAVKYKEVMTRPVRVQPAGCGCDDNACEYSRWCDGYEIGILSACPESHQNMKYTNPDGGPDLYALLQGERFQCLDCPSDPWVVLAMIDVASDGTIKEIDNCSCRRMVVSFADFWWQCTQSDTKGEARGLKVTPVEKPVQEGTPVPVSHTDVQPREEIIVQKTRRPRR